MESMLGSFGKKGGLITLIILFPLVVLAYLFKISWMLSVFAFMGVTKALGDILNGFKN